MAACLRFTRRVWKSFLENKGKAFLDAGDKAIERAVPGTVQASLKLEQYNLNRTQTVHGGLILSLTDTLGSLAVSTRGHFMTGVSTDIGTSFVKPAGTIEDTLSAKAVVVAMGRTLAYTRVEFSNAKGDLVAYGHHTKFVGKALEHENNVKFSSDGERVTEGQDIIDEPEP
ncbi:thioesterase thiol ester dehydrase-isomerase [Sistotremastrum niveocremeum HHB9708]|uniref:Thioesterase thiol ester dehydrase-isomerase n=1 Tax=Sistotremastrum niveocremeum HHB9708 TaxID=1314777 RepID=A0A164TDL0_9AGAM|nr:thioesterase thiol ester dehydrase-isomerase [Sistotremastrum niveocremeum HHB9708]